MKKEENKGEQERNSTQKLVLQGIEQTSNSKKIVLSTTNTTKIFLYISMLTKTLQEHGKN